MKRTIWSLLLAGALVITPLLTACNPEEPADTTAGTTTAETESGTPPARYDYMAADVAADVTLSREDYTNLSLTVPNSLKVEAADVADYVQSIRFQYRQAVDGTAMVTDRPLSMGDDAYIYYKGYLNGEAFEGGSNWDDAEPYKLGLGSGSFIPGFEEGLVGVIPAETSKESPAEIAVTFPADYHAAEMAGKSVIFRVAVVYAVQYTLLDYNRQFVETTLQYQPKQESYESDEALLAEFEAYVQDYLVGQCAEDVENAKVSALWEHLTARAVCKNLPELELSYYVDAYEDDLTYYYNYYTAMGGEEFAEVYPTLDSFAVVYLGLESGADWHAAVSRMAESMVQKHMILHAIAEWEGLESVTEEEFDAQVEIWVDYYSGSLTREDLIKNMGEIFFTESAITDKMEAWLMEQVTFTFEDGSPLPPTSEAA